jgi:cyanophycinase
MALKVPARAVATLVSLLLTSPALASERLVLVGGGDRPVAAMQRFAEWAGGEKARLLMILWATGYPDESFDGLKTDFAKYAPASIEAAPIQPLTPESRAAFLKQLETATGVFFCGGDQVRVMEVLQDRALLDALRARYAAGIVFGGTSAGTAIMSKIMITGEGDFSVVDGTKVETREGLGLLPGTIVDQHFLKRQRENRLFGLVLLHPEALGVGINEDAALLVTDGRHGEVVDGPVMMVDGRGGKGQLTLTLLRPGERFDLVARRRE